MRSKLKWIFTLLVALTMQFSFAQEKTVTGTVSDQSGPLPGANVVVQGSKMNKETKRKEEGVFEKWEITSSHICRRSFASNLYGKLDNLTIMAITGHQTETQFLKYIKITSTEKADKLKEYWNKQNEENNIEEIQMKIV